MSETSGRVAERCVCSGARAACNEAAAYVIVYRDHDAAGFPACVECCAILRANDPLEYIESVRSLPRGDGGAS